MENIDQKPPHHGPHAAVGIGGGGGRQLFIRRAAADGIRLLCLLIRHAIAGRRNDWGSLTSLKDILYVTPSLIIF